MSNISTYVTCESVVNKACILIVMHYNGYKLSNQRNETKAHKTMIILNGNKFAANDTEFTNSLFDTDGTCVGFYKAYKNTVNLLDMQKVKVGVITKHGVLALASKLDNGKWWYSYGDIDLVGAYDKYSDRYNDVKQALTKLN